MPLVPSPVEPFEPVVPMPDVPEVIPALVVPVPRPVVLELVPVVWTPAPTRAGVPDAKMSEAMATAATDPRRGRRERPSDVRSARSM